MSNTYAMQAIQDLSPNRRIIMAFVIMLCACLPWQASAHTVHLPANTYRGLLDRNASTTIFYGIPYATATRFKPPKPLSHDGNTTYRRTAIDTTKHGPACMQFAIPPPYDEGFDILLGTEPLAPQSEECLRMDVYVPHVQNKKHLLPVLFFTPGGGLLNGASFIYDMRAMIQHAAEIGKPFIGVAINYRLGPLGFLDPSTFRDDEINLGFADQTAALRFVNQNIGAFGGDKNRVTIMGQSAGAESMMYQRVFGDPTLFRAAWLASVPSAARAFTSTAKKPKDELVQSYAAACGCFANSTTPTVEASVECLRKVDVNVLVNASLAWQGSGSSLGGTLVRHNVFSAITASSKDHGPRVVQVPTIFSACRDEGTSSAIGFRADSDALIEQTIQGMADSQDHFSPQESKRFLTDMQAAYPNDPTKGCPYDGQNTTYGQPSQFKRLAAIMTDGTYTAAWRKYINVFSQSHQTWAMQFDAPFPGRLFGPEYGVQHGSDLSYFFPTILGRDADPRNAPHTTRIHRLMLTALAHFVTDLDPSTNETHWPSYSSSPDGNNVIYIGSNATTTIQSPPDRPGLDVIDRIWPTVRA